MDFPVHLLVLLARHRFLFLPASLVLSAVIGATIRRRTGRSASWGALVILAAFLNVMIGPDVGAWLLYHTGRTAPAGIVGTYRTSTRYNGRMVVGYEILIRIAEDDTVSERFEDDELNVHPAPDGYVYPRPGDIFNVRVLPHFPRDFVIVADDDSPWAQHLRCGRLGDRLVDARRRFTFAQGQVPFRTAYAAAITSYLDGGCANGADDAEAYRRDRAGALLGVTDTTP